MPGVSAGARLWAWLRRRAGHRGLALAILAAFDLARGAYLLAGAPEHTLSFPQAWWGVIWAACGLFLLTGVPARRDRWQFAAAVLVKTAWALEYARAALASSLAYDWARTAEWLALAALVIAIAGWPEPA